MDGFNLYYGAVKGTPHKWLDLQRLFESLRPDDEIQTLKYFTALVDGPKQQNQLAFLAALGSLPKIEIIQGKFKKKRIRCIHPKCQLPGDRFFESQEEKHTDVNIALHMLDDAYRGKCDISVLVSGDSDLVPAVSMVRSRFPALRVVVYAPVPVTAHGRHAMELKRAAHAGKNLPHKLIETSQFPDVVTNARTGQVIKKPATW
ncbi:MAG: NYN domain-containing protein [Acidobacteriota bacterium]